MASWNSFCRLGPYIAAIVLLIIGLVRPSNANCRSHAQCENGGLCFANRCICPGDFIGTFCEITVTQPRFVDCPSDLVVNTTTGSTAKATWSPPTVSGGIGPIHFNSSASPGSQFDVGITWVVYYARDAEGRETNCTFHVTVVVVDCNHHDQCYNGGICAFNVCYCFRYFVGTHCEKDLSPPRFVDCPSDLVVNTTMGSKANVTWAAPTVTGGIGLIHTNASASPGSLFDVGITPVVYYARDGLGRETNCTFSVLVNVTNGPGPDVSTEAAVITTTYYPERGHCSPAQRRHCGMNECVNVRGKPFCLCPDVNLVKETC